MAFSDKEIIVSIQNGKDEKALAYLYKSLLPKIKLLVRNNGGTADEANDIFQDAILVFYKHVKLHKFDEKYDIAGFIYSVSRNLWINYVKRQNRQLPLNEAGNYIELDPGVLSNLITSERETQVHNILGQLGDKCKELLVSTIYHKLSMKEICEKMGFSTENAAKTRHYKCKQKLIELVGNGHSFRNLLQ